jgi:hypothetical protein
VDLRGGLDGMEKRKFWTYLDSNSELSVVQSVGRRYTYMERVLFAFEVNIFIA